VVERMAQIYIYSKLLSKVHTLPEEVINYLKLLYLRRVRAG